MNDFGIIDYKNPIGQQNDQRTSTYRGHIHLTDTMLGNELHGKFSTNKNYHEDSLLANGRVSDYRQNFVWKYPNPFESRNPTLDRKVQFIKPFDECQLRFLKRQMRPVSSVSHQDYLWKPKDPEENPSPIRMPRAVETTKIIIDHAKPGFTKYLDSNATTSRLAFVTYTPEELMASIAAKDNITFWNWNSKQMKQNRVFREKDEQMCEKMAAKECPKRRCEFPSLVKHVPHTGLTTEVRDNYLEPRKHTLDYDISHLRNHLVNFPFVPFAKNTESKVIGSGERTQKYV